MLKFEIAEVIENGNLYELSEKINYNRPLTKEEKEISELGDAWVKETAEKHDPNKEFAAYIQKVVEEEIYDLPTEFMEAIFEMGSIGEFDVVDYTYVAQNTLQAHEAAKGGVVDRSFIDFKIFAPQTRNFQIETDLSYVDTRKNGFKNLSTLTTFMVEALENQQYYDMMTRAAAAVTGGEQLIVEGGSTVTLASMDALSLYINDRTDNGLIVGLSKHIQPIKRMEGFKEYFLSDNMKDEFNRFYLPTFFDGLRITGIPSARRFSQNIPAIPEKIIFGFAGEIGKLDMKGEMHTYENYDDYNERIHLMIKDFTYQYVIHRPEYIAKIVLQ